MAKQNNSRTRMKNNSPTSTASPCIQNPMLPKFSRMILRDNPLPCHGQKLDAVDYLLSRISGVANAFSKPMEIDEPFRTLFTSAGRKQTMHVPTLCRTLG